jgi:hypothetical protein
MLKIPDNRTIVRLLICPTSRFANSLSSPFRKNISLFPKPKSVVVFASSRPTEGRFAIVTDVERGMRWTLMARETDALDADGEDVWSWRPDAGVKLAEEIPLMTGAREPGPRGEHGVSRKPLRGECRVFPV